MKTEVAIDGLKFLINGKPTYEGLSNCGRSIEGLLFNSRMIQAVFDDANPETARHWAYPDTEVWDPDRNTDEFCAALPLYRKHGLLGFTVGLQGGGSIYTDDVYAHYRASAFDRDASIKPEWLARLGRVLKAADENGMVVIVSCFYGRCMWAIESQDLCNRMVENATRWLLETGYRNVMVEVFNESSDPYGGPWFQTHQIAGYLDIVRQQTLDGRRLLVGNSAFPGVLPTDDWLDREDFTMPHGNGTTPDQLRARIREFRALDGYKRRPRPILVNECSPLTNNLDAAIDEYASWGLYYQGYGAGNDHDLWNWSLKPRETRFEDLSGYQTLPVNWGINDPLKEAFFGRLKQITSGAPMTG